ncbi:MAG: Polyketide cyclase/dehydrase [Ramlibacter sp.]|uniref:SRPBCC domain-containing protein n=1 Tax=Ramlibacter sp. TaxID=1917967 RepID=UPI002607E4BF|nr:SRPBCC domain-containing protein [Ramlibacter sp.]MDB5753352.1 Polyketide cyclase/dehydrase [Ramlibacter sp.]
MHEIATEIRIDASAQRVWDELVDFASHPDWNPFIREISGVPQVGQQLKILVQPAGGKGMRFQPMVLAATPGQELRWRGRWLVPGLFDGEHYFRITATGAGTTQFVHGEKFSGVLVPLARKSLDGATRAGFEAMNQALKTRAERPARVTG